MYQEGVRGILGKSTHSHAAVGVEDKVDRNKIDGQGIIDHATATIASLL
jgi:hypothetical protein